MFLLRQSSNYAWCTANFLGEGASAEVFRGVRRDNGEHVAVKSFSHLSKQTSQIREFEVMKKLKHENVVKLLAMEEELNTRSNIIVMELCTGGSLFDVLDDPENTYGIQEDEFLLVLEHLSSAMQYLRDNNIVHGDLKPDNIMKYVCEDGSSVYKLADFGSACELKENEQFFSVKGTSEYMHPDVYKSIFLTKSKGKSFKATVELWSLGVTLYEVATGNKPFRPYGGRKDKATMHYITSMKASGVISGTQCSENGPINWSRSLPKECEMSVGLIKYMTPLIAGLLEVDAQKMWSFEHFFKEVTHILSLKRLHVFHINKMQNIKIYFDPNNIIFNCFKEQVCEQSGVLPGNQELIFNNKNLKCIVQDGTLGKDYPTTTPEVPIILFNLENHDEYISFKTDLPKLPTFYNPVNIENDVCVVKEICSISHACKRNIEKLSLCNKLIHYTVRMHINSAKREIHQVFLKTNWILELVKHLEKSTEIIMRNQRTLSRLKNPSCPDWKAELESVINQASIRNICNKVKEMYPLICTDDFLTTEWEKTSAYCHSSWEHKAPQRAATCVKSLRDSWLQMIHHEDSKHLTRNDEQLHILERKRVSNLGNNLMKNILEKEVYESLFETIRSFSKWYETVQTVIEVWKHLDDHIENAKQILEHFFHRME